MRLRNERRKALIIEEAWKAIASKLMGGYILYLYKTVRKFWGETIVVTQELNDIIGNAVVKDSIISNSDTFILLDQSKFKDNFGAIADILSLNQVEQNKIWTINNLNNKYGRARFKEFYLKRGGKGEVYGNEVSLEQYLTYTTEKPEKSAVEHYAKAIGSINEKMDNMIPAGKIAALRTGEMVGMIAGGEENDSEEYKSSAFSGKINLDMKAISKEEQNYVPLPTYYSFLDKTGKNRKEEVLMTNFRKINKEVELIIKDHISS